MLQAELWVEALTGGAREAWLLKRGLLRWRAVPLLPLAAPLNPAALSPSSALLMAALMACCCLAPWRDSAGALLLIKGVWVPADTLTWLGGGGVPVPSVWT